MNEEYGASERLRVLPKAELHLHIEGTLEADLAYALAAQNAVDLPFSGVDDLANHYVFSNLQEFLDLYYTVISVLRTKDDFADLGRAYLTRAASQGVRHAEIFFDPQAHLSRGVELDAVLGGLQAAMEEADSRYGLSSGLILCFLRDQPVRDALDVLDLVLSSDPGSIVGVGLDSAEIGHSPREFRQVFEQARAAGLRLCAHAGEEGPPLYIWEALDELGVERIDHGIRAADDPALVRRLADDGTTLTVCPLSNVRLRACQSLEQHPIMTLFDQGVHVTINSDDPAYFGGYIATNYAAVSTALKVPEAQLAEIARNSVAGSWAPRARKEAILAEIEEWDSAAGR